MLVGDTIILPEEKVKDRNLGLPMALADRVQVFYHVP